MTYAVRYDPALLDLAEVEIPDLAVAEPVMKAMLLFWTDGEWWIHQDDGNILHAWLRMLGAFVMRHQRIPGKDDEGWCILDGSQGIKAKGIDDVQFEHADIEIVELIAEYGDKEEGK